MTCRNAEPFLQTLTTNNLKQLEMTKKLPTDFEYLKDMYGDDYFPNFLVDKIRDLIKDTVLFIEEGNHSNEEIQASLDKMTLGINELENEFSENDSELETGARESIGDTVDQILKYFKIDIDIEEAIRQREW
jgi:methyl-accepting chemotaxis protein